MSSPTPPRVRKTIVDLPVTDLVKAGGGAWNLKKKVDWKKSSVTTFQGQPALKVFYAKNSGTSKHPGVGGMGICSVPRGLPGKEVIVSFDAFFAPGWNFSRGGKLAGFHIGHGEASGYRHSDTGASHRLMWQAKGGAISYVYPPSNLPQVDPKLKAEGHGVGYFQDVFPAGTLKVGKWHTIEIGVKLNSFDDNGKPCADGKGWLSIDGTSAKLANIRWARAPNLLISSFDFGTFFGGPDPSLVDCTAYFRNFKLMEWKKTPAK